MSYVIVLADRVHEANAYAKHAGLLRGRFRFATSAGSIRGLRVAEIHELPSFSRRPDRHSINAELRYVRGERRMVEPAPRVVRGPVDQGDGMGEQTTIDDLLVEMAQALKDEGVEHPEVDAILEFGADDEIVPADRTSLMQEMADIVEEQEAELEPAPEPEPAARRRRSRCKDCGDLDFPETHACPVAMRPAGPVPNMFD